MAQSKYMQTSYPYFLITFQLCIQGLMLIDIPNSLQLTSHKIIVSVEPSWKRKPGCGNLELILVREWALNQALHHRLSTSQLSLNQTQTQVVFLVTTEVRRARKEKQSWSLEALKLSWFSLVSCSISFR